MLAQANDGIRVLALGVLLLHMALWMMSRVRRPWGVLLPSDLAGPRLPLVWDSAAALVVLIVAAGLGTYKPPGQTWWTRRPDTMSSVALVRSGRWLKALMIVTGILLACKSFPIQV